MKKIKEFAEKLNEIVAKEMDRMDSRTDESIIKIDSVTLDSFTNERPYEGSLENAIFFTYNDHYSANSGIHMCVGSLGHAHVNMDDRGYIKGVATNLSGYMALRSMKPYSNAYMSLYMPKFRNSKHAATYRTECLNLMSTASAKLDAHKELMNDRINGALKNKTGMSLLYYIRAI